jgi:hypothetical protein
MLAFDGLPKLVSLRFIGEAKDLEIELSIADVMALPA